MTTSAEGSALVDDGSAENNDKNGRHGQVSYESHQRLLNQKKKAEEKARALEEKLQSELLAKQKAEGKKDEVITTLESDLEKERRAKRELLQNMTKKTIRGEITKAAVERGIRPEKLNLFLEVAEKDFFNEESEIQVDENFNLVNREKFESVFDGRAKQVNEWFQKSVNEPGDVIPSGKGVKAPAKKLSDMDMDELASLL